MTTKNKIIDLHKYRDQQQLKKQIEELESLREHFKFRVSDPVVRKGYNNFMKLIKGIDKKYEKDHNND